MSKEKRQQRASNRKAAKSKFHHHLEVPPIRESYQGTGKLDGRVALITGGDSGIGRAIAVHFAREGADVAINFLDSDRDARETQAMVAAEGRRCLLVKGDVSKETFCKSMIEAVIKKLGRLSVLVNNAGMHEEDHSIQEITGEQLRRTFATNIFSCFYCTKAALAVLDKQGTIINTASVVAYRGSNHLLDYSATKGGIVAFTRSLSSNLAKDGIRVNAVAPGPVWTPLVIGAFTEKELAKFGKDAPLGRAGYPQEIAPAYVFLASEDSIYMSGQVLHVNGGEIVNG